MSVVFSRIATPAPGRLGESMAFAKERIAALEKTYGIEVRLMARLGGPAGQLNMVSYHDSLGDLESLRRRIIEDTQAGTIPTPPVGLFADVQDNVWMRA